MKNFSISLVYGIATGICLIVYFLILALLDLHINPAYSIFNLIITGLGIFLAVKKYREKKAGKFKFQKGLGTGLATGIIATVIFTAFFAIYASEINPDFPLRLITMWETDWFVNIGMLIFTVALMGLATSFVVSLSMMQLYKPSKNTKEGQKHTY